jgi:chorismate synthase
VTTKPPVISDSRTANAFNPGQELTPERPIRSHYGSVAGDSHVSIDRTGAAVAVPVDPVPSGFGDTLTVVLPPDITAEAKIVSAIAGVSIDTLVSWAVRDACARVRAGAARRG